MMRSGRSCSRSPTAGGLPRSLQRVRMRRRDERQTFDHDRVRETLEPGSGARAGGVREPSERGDTAQAQRLGGHPPLEQGRCSVSRASTWMGGIAPPQTAVRMGIRANLGQFSLLVLVNAFVGAMVGLERSILPALAERDFHVAARAAILSFIV